MTFLRRSLSSIALLPAWAGGRTPAVSSSRATKAERMQRLRQETPVAQVPIRVTENNREYHRARLARLGASNCIEG